MADQARWHLFAGIMGGEKNAASDMELGLGSIQEEDRMRSPIRRTRSQRTDWSEEDLQMDSGSRERVKWQSVPDVRNSGEEEGRCGEDDFQKQI